MTSPFQVHRWALPTLCTLVLLIVPGAAQRLPAQAATGAVEADSRQLAERMDRVLGALDASDRQLPHDTFDPAAVIAHVGKDPAKLFAWVRDNTYCAAYRGALRGPLGVLMDRTGNSLDRAVLLAELLRYAGQEHLRLMHAELSAETARDLLRHVRTPPEDLGQQLDARMDTNQQAAELDRFAGQVGLELRVLQNAAKRSDAAARRLAEDVTQRVTAQVPALAAAIGAPLEAPQDAIAEDAASDHWWLAYQAGERWIDLDPSLPDALPGTHVGDAPGTPVALAGRLPAAQDCQTVQLTVVIEQWDNGGLHEQTILTQAICPAEVLGQRVALTMLPPDWPGDLDLFGAQAPADKLRETAALQHQWVPVLTLGEQTVYQGGFTDTGLKIEHPQLNPVSKAGGGTAQAAQRVADLFSPDPGPAAPAAQAPASNGVLTAVWLEYELRLPGRAPRKTRRQWLDIIGPAARAAGKIPRPQLDDGHILDRALALLGPTEIFLQPCRVPRPVIEHLAARDVLANRSVLVGMVRAWREGPKAVHQQLDRAVPPLGPLYVLAYERGQGGELGANAWLDRPNVLTHHTLLRRASGSPVGGLAADVGFDIVFNDVAARPGADAFKVRMKQGVADTAAEAALLAHAEGGAPSADGNASTLYAAALGNGQRWTVLRGAGDQQFRQVQLPDNARARIAQDLADGYVVLVPARAGPLAAWWRVDPATGQTLGIGPHGWGPAVAEDTIMHLRVAVKGALYLKCLGGAHGAGEALLCSGAFVGGLGGMVIGGKIGGTLSLVADAFSLLK
jgi:hypothetical protein